MRKISTIALVPVDPRCDGGMAPEGYQRHREHAQGRENEHHDNTKIKPATQRRAHRMDATRQDDYGKNTYTGPKPPRYRQGQGITMADRSGRPRPVLTPKRRSRDATASSVTKPPRVRRQQGFRSSFQGGGE